MPSAGSPSKPCPPVAAPLALLAELTYLCPLKCPHCSNPLDYSRPRRELTRAEWLDLLQQGRELGAVRLGLSGGEPLLRADLLALIDGASALGYYTHLITSGIGLTEARLATFRHAGLACVQLALQAAEATLNDRLVGSSGAFAKVRALAQAVKAQGLPLVLSFVLHRHNIDQLDAMVELGLALAADRVDLTPCDYSGWARSNRAQLAPTGAQLQQARRALGQWRQQLSQQSRALQLSSAFPIEPAEAAPSGLDSHARLLRITPDGRALPGAQPVEGLPPVEMPDVRKHSLQQIWYEDPLFATLREQQMLHYRTQQAAHQQWLRQGEGGGELKQALRQNPVPPADLEALRLRTKRNAKVLLRREQG